MSVRGEAARLLAEASVLGEGPGADYVPAGHRAYGHRDPSGSSGSTFSAIAARFSRCQTEAELQVAVLKAQRDVDDHRQGKSWKKETTEDRDRRLLRDFAGVEVEEAARIEGCRVRHFRQLRFLNGRSPEDGTILGVANMKWATPKERAERVKALSEATGMTARQIGRMLNVSHTTALTDLKKAA